MRRAWGRQWRGRRARLDHGEFRCFLGLGGTPASSWLPSCARNRGEKEAFESSEDGEESAEWRAVGGRETRCRRGRHLPRPWTARCAQHGRKQHQHLQHGATLLAMQKEMGSGGEAEGVSGERQVQPRVEFKWRRR